MKPCVHDMVEFDTVLTCTRNVDIRMRDWKMHG